MSPTDDLVKEWRVPRPNLLVQMAWCPFWAGFAGSLACRADTLETVEKSIVVGIISLMGVGCLLFMAHLWAVWVNRIQIDATRIRVFGLFGIREINFADMVAMRFLVSGPSILFGEKHRLVVRTFGSLRHSDRVEIVRFLDAKTNSQGNTRVAYDQIFKPISRLRNGVRVLLSAALLLFGLGYTIYSMFGWDRDPFRQLGNICGGVFITLLPLGLYFYPSIPLVEAAEATA